MDLVAVEGLEAGDEYGLGDFEVLGQLRKAQGPSCVLGEVAEIDQESGRLEMDGSLNGWRLTSDVAAEQVYELVG